MAKALKISRKDRRDFGAVLAWLIALFIAQYIVISALTDMFTAGAVYIEDFTSLLLPVGITSIIFIVLIIGFRKSKGFVPVVVLVLISVCFAYKSVTKLNCYLDKSVPKMYELNVINRRLELRSYRSRTSKNFYKKYYLGIISWRGKKEIEEIEVSKDVFDQKEIGDKIQIASYNGRFGIRWFEVK